MEAISQSLPLVVDPASVSLRAKIPYKVLCYREGLIWRIEELSRTACDCYDKGDVVAAIILTRSATEVSAAAWYMMELVNRQIEHGVQPDLDDKVMKLLLGHKNATDMPVAINVLTFMDILDKTLPGVRRAYDTLSEYAHPNWSGTALAYSKNDTTEFLTNFGKGLRAEPDNHAAIGLNCLLGSLEVFEWSYNSISEAMPDFIRVCEADLS